MSLPVLARQRYFIYSDVVDNEKLREQLNCNYDAAVAVAISMIRQIRSDGEGAVPHTMDVMAMAVQILRCAMETLKEM